MKEKSEAFDMSAEDKRLLNMLQIKMYDISQNIEIIGKQLTNNQIKDVIANTYHIFSQLKRIFENAGMNDVFEVVKKMQVNSVALSTILTERIDRKAETVKIKMQQVQPSIEVKDHVIEVQAPKEGKTRHSKLGGICLYNQSYMRGLQYYQVDTESLEQMSGKCRIKQSKKSKDEFLSSVSRELDSKAEVEMETIADEIKKYINDYKQNSKINSCVSYEKELVEIIDFFKISELEAMSFLNKSPKNQEYTEDYMNRLNDLEHQFKNKEKAEKMSINEKLRFFIINLKVKLHDMERKYQQKNLKLLQFEQSLKRVTTSTATQTYDGFESRLKSQEMTIKELQDRYKILSQLKNKEINFESKYYEAFHDLNIKNTEITKIKNLNLQLQSQIEYLKKLIRQNKEKLNVDLKDLEKRRNKNKKIGKEVSKKQIEEGNNEHENNQATELMELERRSSKMQKKTKRLERVQTSSIFKPNELAEIAKQSQIEAFLEEEKGEIKQLFPKLQQGEEVKPSYLKIQHKKTGNSPLSSKQGETKESLFKNEYKRNTKKASEEERQVSFLQQKSKKILNQIGGDCSSYDITPGNLSIDNIRNDDDPDENSQKTSKKNTLRQIINSAKSSMRSLEGQSKKSSKIVSKKCIFLKDNKQKEKNLLATTIKLQQLTIRDVMSITIFPQPQTIIRERKERPSYPFANNQSLNSGTSIKSNTKLNHISQNTSKSKPKLNNQSIYEMQRIRSIEGMQKNAVLQSLKKRDNNGGTIKKSISKKQNIDGHTSKHYLPIQSQNIQPQGNLRKIDRNQLQRNHNSFQNKNGKAAASYMQSINSKQRDVSLCDKITEENWQNPLESSQATTLANYILDEITKEQLNLQEFKEIVKCLEDEAHHLQYVSIPNESTPKNVQQFNTNSDRLDDIIHSKRYTKIKDRRQTKDTQQERGQFRPKKEEIYGVGDRAYLHIREVHQRMGNCRAHGNEPCEHLMKYLKVLRRVNEMSGQKHVLKLHIEKIGQILQENSKKTQKNAREERKSVEKLQQFLLKTSPSGYIKGNNPIFDQSLEQQRDRILPIINTTSSAYYKPKGKHYIK